MTSMPASRAATAICSAPLEWPSRPGLPTSTRIGWPSSRARSWTSLAHRDHVGADRRVHAADAGRCAVFAEHLAQRVGPLADGAARACERDRGGHQACRRAGDGAQVVERAATASASRADAPRFEGLELFLFGVFVDDEDRATHRRARPRAATARFGEAVDPDHGDFADFRCAGPVRRGSAPAGPSSRRSSRTRRRRRAPSCSSASAASTSSAVLASTTCDPVEEVVVLEQVGLVREHLLDAQRPLLVPRPRQPERLVPGRELHRAGAGVLRERHAERSRARCAARCSRAAPR